MVGALISNIAQEGVNIQIYTSSMCACRKRLRLFLNGGLGGPHGCSGSFGKKQNPFSCRRSKQSYSDAQHFV